jgi:hypothetical protein
MTMIPDKSREDLAKKLIPLFIIAILGTLGIAAIYSLMPGLQIFELALLFIVVGFSTAGYTQNILRGIGSAVMLYIATGLAATFYPVVTPYVGGIQQALRFNVHASPGEIVNRGTLALSFILLTVIVWGALGLITRASFHDTSLPWLGILDNLGSLLIYAVIGILVASLLFNAVGYGHMRNEHDRAQLRSAFNHILHLYYTTQSFWFPSTSPTILVYDLNVPR